MALGTHYNHEANGPEREIRIRYYTFNRLIGYSAERLTEVLP